MNKPVQVLHIITRLDPGGSAENTVLSVERVDPARFESRVWTGPGLFGVGPTPEYGKRLAGKIEIIPRLVRPIRPWNDFLAPFSLMRRLREVNPDIIHLHSAKVGVVGRIAVKLSGTKAKVIYTPHGHVFSGYGGSMASAIFTLLERWLAKWCDAIVALTPDEVKEFLAHNAGKPEQFHIVPSGVELAPYEAASKSRKKTRAKLGFSEDVLLAGFVGRLEEVKGPDRFLEVAQRLLGSHPGMKFLVIGDGSMMAELQRKAGYMGLADSILWTGWRLDVPELISTLDILLVTSRNEGQGRVVVEAAGAGVPTVALKTGGLGEVIVPGETGMLIDNGDLAALADVTSELLADPKRRERMGIAARKYAKENYSVEVMTRKLEELYIALAT